MVHCAGVYLWQVRVEFAIKIAKNATQCLFALHLVRFAINSDYHF